MTKIEKQMVGGVIVFALLVVVMIKSIAFVGEKAYYEYKAVTDAHKSKCLDKFKTIDYEVVDDVLYCKSVDGLVKYK